MNNTLYNITVPCYKSFGSCPDPDVIIPTVQRIQNKIEIQAVLLGVVALLIVIDLFNKWR